MLSGRHFFPCTKQSSAQWWEITFRQKGCTTGTSSAGDVWIRRAKWFLGPGSSACWICYYSWLIFLSLCCEELSDIHLKPPLLTEFIRVLYVPKWSNQTQLLPHGNSFASTRIFIPQNGHHLWINSPFPRDWFGSVASNKIMTKSTWGLQILYDEHFLDMQWGSFARTFFIPLHKSYCSPQISQLLSDCTEMLSWGLQGK